MKKVTVPIDKHVTMIGETGEGKTPVCDNIGQNSNTGTFVFDLEGLNEFDSDMEADRASDVSEIRETLADGGTVVFEVSENEEERMKEVENIWSLLKSWKLHVLVIGDEIQEYGSEESNPFTVYATRGRKYGVHLVAVSQRIANVPKTVVTQSNVIIHFEVSEMEEKYYKNRNVPFEPFSDLQNYEKHSFKVYARGDGVSSPFKLNLS